MNKLNYYLHKFFGKYATMIDQKSVIKEVYADLQLSADYFAMLNLANLIALFGLLVNSIAVIIGAMLISPLMGPMISFGFAFVTGDNVVWKKSLKKIVVSVFITISIAALATYFSPLNDITNEILSRTKPNLFDLLVAFLAGSAGAAAICTKKNYLTVVPGVAIATAVIPPLSVAGFGVGIGNWYIAAGGFSLFFINFVAIVITSCFVFFFYGFRPITNSEIEKDKLKKRIILLFLLLFTISIPLIYVLGVTLSEAKLKKDVKTALQDVYDKKGSSKLSTFTYFKHENGILEIDATVQTTQYIKKEDILAAEKLLTDELQRKVKSNIQQDKVIKGGLKEDEDLAPLPLPRRVEPLSPRDLISNAREDILGAAKKSVGKIEDMISPSQVTDYSVGIHKNDSLLSVHLKIRRDTSLSSEQILWLQKIMTADLKSPVALSVEATPFVPTLVFSAGEISLTDEIRNTLLILKQVSEIDNSVRVVIESGPESSLPYRRRISVARQRAEAIAAFINTNCNIPSLQIKIKLMPKAKRIPMVRVSVLPTELNQVR